MRNIFNFYDTSQIAALYRTSLIPLFFVLFGWITPSDMRERYR